jgi:hypothetical protein
VERCRLRLAGGRELVLPNVKADYFGLSYVAILLFVPAFIALITGYLHARMVAGRRTLVSLLSARFKNVLANLFAIAVSIALVENGWRVLFTRTTDLVQRLQLARRDLSLESAIDKLDRYHLLILDGLAYVTKDQAETSVLFELISARYETPIRPDHRQSALRRMGQNLPGRGHDARRNRLPRPSLHHLRDECRKLSTQRSRRSQAQRRRAANPRDNQLQPRR